MLQLFKKDRKVVKVPEVLTQQEDPVNYNSVLDYLVGLSKTEYDKLFKVANVYRNANKDAAKILGVKDEPTTQLKSDQPTEEQIDEGIDTILDADMDSDFLFEDEEPAQPAVDGLKKPQQAKKQIDVK